MYRRDLLAGVGAVALGAPGAARRRAGGQAARESARERNTYRNPVFEQIFPDPDALRHDGAYYAYGTYHPWTGDEGPDRQLVPILRSPNLVDWERVGPAFEAPPPWSQYRGLWAPGVARLADRVVLYYSDSEFGAPNPGIGVATASDPAGPFEPRGGLFRSAGVDVPNSIDPTVFVRRETSYLFWGSHRGLYGIELAADGLGTRGEPFPVVGRGVEAPYVVERDGRCYLFGSRGTCCRGTDSTYRVVVGRADEFRGPYRNRAGGRLTADAATGTTILQSGERFIGPGHCSVVRDREGGWWLLYHAYERGEGWIGDTPRRVLLLDRIRWRDGWPEVGDGTPSADGEVPTVDA